MNRRHLRSVGQGGQLAAVLLIIVFIVSLTVVAREVGATDDAAGISGKSRVEYGLDDTGSTGSEPLDKQQQPICDVSPTFLDFGTILRSSSHELSFTISNVGTDTLYGSVSEACTWYSITEGGGPYGIGPGEFLTVTVEAYGGTPGVQTCNIATGTECDTVFCLANVDTLYVPMIVEKWSDVVGCASPGDTVTYTILYSNPNPAEETYYDVYIVDRLSPETNFVSASGSENYYNPATHDVTWYISEVLAFDTSYVTVVVEVDSLAAPGGSLSDTCTIQSYETPPAQAWAEINVCEAVYEPLMLGKAYSYPGCVWRGQTMTYAITYTNPNALAVTNVVVADTLPLEIEFVSATGGGIHDPGPPETVTWPIGTLGGLASDSVHMTVTVSDEAPYGYTIWNTCTIRSDETPTVDAWTATDICACGIDGPDEVCPSSVNQYCGPPDMLEYTWELTGYGTIVSPADTQCVWVEADFACDDATYSVELTVMDPDSALSMCSMTAFVSDVEPPTITACPAGFIVGCTSEVPPPNIGELVAVDNCDSDLSVAYTDSIAPLGCPEKYRIHRTWTATDECGNSVSCVQIISVADTTEPYIFCATPDTIVRGEPIVFTEPFFYDDCDTMPTLAIVSTDTLAGPDTLTYTRCWEAYDNCGNLSNVCCQDVVQLPSEYLQLSLTKDDNISVCADSADTIYYTITFDNPNPLPVTAVVIEDRLPDMTGFVSASGGGLYDPGAHRVTWNIGGLAAGSGDALILAVELSPEASGILEDTCRIYCAEASDSEVVETTLLCPSGFVPLDLEKHDNIDGFVVPGDQIEYKIKFGNPVANDKPVTHVILPDQLPEETDYVSSSPQGTYNPVAHEIVWSIGTLQPGQQDSIYLTVQVKPTVAPGIDIVNRCQIYSDQTAPFFTEANETTLVTPNIIEGYLDIKPGGCPNIVNHRNKGVIPAAIVGDDDLDVALIDASSIRLMRDGVIGRVLPLRWSYEDVGTPFVGEICDCHELKGDRREDLTLKFSTVEATNTLGLAPAAGTAVPVVALANMPDDWIVRGIDCLSVLHTGKKGDSCDGRGIGFESCERRLANAGCEIEISYYIEATVHVRLEIFDVRGRRVKTLLDAVKDPGIHAVSWDETDDAGSRIPPGVYFARLHSETGRCTRKVIKID